MGSTFPDVFSEIAAVVVGHGKVAVALKPAQLVTSRPSDPATHSLGEVDSLPQSR